MTVISINKAKMNLIYNIVKILAFFGITVSFAKIVLFVNDGVASVLGIFEELQIGVAFGTALVGFLFFNSQANNLHTCRGSE